VTTTLELVGIPVSFSSAKVSWQLNILGTKIVLSVPSTGWSGFIGGSERGNQTHSSFQEVI